MLGGTFAPAFLERRFGQSNGSDCLCNAAQMERVLRREIARADRGGRGFSLVLFRVKPGQPDHQGTRQLVHVLLKRARLTDEVGWFSEGYLCAMLTGTPENGARIFAEGVIEAVSRHAPRPIAVVYSYPSANVSLPGRSVASEDTDSAASDLNRPANGHRQSDGRQSTFKNLNGDHSTGDLNSHADSEDFDAAAPQKAARQVAIDPRDLLNFVKSGFNSADEQPGLPAGSVGELLAAPLPWWKRWIDIAGAAVGIILSSPLMLIAAMSVRLSSPGPIIFSQKRSGLGGKPFQIYKFRTMVVNAEAKRKELAALSEQDGPAFKLTNDPRLTKIGRILRKTSIDELPQLFNVLKGDMSLVGPRPLPCSESEGCLPWQKHRMNITPGLTCIWQVKGRSRVGFDDWVRMDMAYMRRRTLWKDIQIIFATIPAVLLRRGAK
jgi:lipopolysaccharide/colanic/teichoic acid biosynthesis glycosyltransferase